jgi:iron complex outermembrane receptor protein
MTSTMRRHLLASTLITGIFAATTPAFAQVTEPVETSLDAQVEDQKPDTEIVVTGSRIGRPDLETSSPVNVVGQQEILLRQPGTAEELLRTLPSVRPSIGPGVNNGSDGSATINLRGIGDNRSLVLLDGRRIVPFGLDNLTDTNVIPVGLIERVDIVTGGASSVYGADAVAGVVNFITKRDFSGVEGTSNYRISQRGDAARYRGDILIGANLADGKGNVVLGLGYTKSDPLLHTQRSVGAFPISSANGQFSGATSAQVTIFASPSNAALGLPASSFGAVVNPATGLLQAATAADTYNTNIGTYFQTPLNKVNVYSAAHYEVAKDIEVYTSAMYSRSQVRLQLASSATFGNTYQLGLNNPYLTPQLRNQLCRGFDTNTAVAGIQSISTANCDAAGAAQGGPGTAGYIEIPVVAQRRFTEYGPRGNPITSQMFQVQGGVRGKVTNGIKFDLSGQYGETSQEQIRENWGSFSKVQQALRAYRTPTGAPRCVDTANNCVPLNLFGPNGSITADQLAFIDLDALINRKTKLTVITGNAGGDLFGLTSPLADSAVGFSIGAEYRKVSARSQPDGASQIQGEVLGTGARTPADFGQISAKEVFGEIAIPLVENVPGIYRLIAEGGVRYSDYSTTGGSTTWKAGGQYEPVRGVKFRGNYQRAVRSPNIAELFASPVQALGNLNPDPCQGAVTGGLAALCVATGAPAGTIGSIPSPTSGQINVTTAGNRLLDVERARTYTLGGVVAPDFLPGFSLTVDYFNILVKDAITQPSQGDILNGCYSAALNPGFAYNGFCQLIGRNPLTGSLNGAGETPGVILSYSNLGVIETAGIDFGVTQRVRLQDAGVNVPGQVTMGFNATWLDYYHFQSTPNAINRDCTGYYSTNCTNPRPEWKWNGRVTYSQEFFDLSLLWNHVSSVRIEPFLSTALTPVSTPQTGGPNPSTLLDAYERIKAYDYFDLSFRFLPTDMLELTLTVDNLFDKQPPLVGSGVGGTSFNSGNTFPTTYDAIGRSYTAGVRLRF